MTDVRAVDVFVEDAAHEQFLLPLLRRMADEARVSVRPHVRAARGGEARALDEMAAAQRVLASGGLAAPLADLFLVGIDGNCTSANEKRKQIRLRSLPAFADRLVVACPDPHIEKWYMADPESFERVVEARPRLGPEKCKRDHYKRLLASTVRGAGHPALLGGIEFAADLVIAMDLHRAGRADAALGQFVGELRGALQRLR